MIVLAVLIFLALGAEHLILKKRRHSVDLDFTDGRSRS
jgi:hypothetical protein